MGLDHERGQHTRFWHYYPDDYGPALCGNPALSGTPIVGKFPGPTCASPSQVCYDCLAKAQQLEQDREVEAKLSDKFNQWWDDLVWEVIINGCG